MDLMSASVLGQEFPDVNLVRNLTDVDVFDGIIKRGRLFSGDRRSERVQVHNHQVDRANPVLLQC